MPAVAKKRKGAKKAAKKKGGETSHDLEHYKSQARKLGIALSKDGHKKTKPELKRAIAYRQSK